jgi:UDP-N-acetylglucosamine--N-acetylmuramyl-(pentapeptide) pyrophosphoryl-undecaprenol N-acetylglucosamine transferase
VARREALRVVCYAVNGTGVGHITRLLAIARWMRRYAAALDQKLEIWFLTSSEAEGLAFAEGFAAFKIPSKTIVAEVGIDRTAYVALAKQWIWHTLGLLRPDLLIVDTFPRGSFGELLGALDLCRRSAFVYRPVRQEVAERPDFQAMLPLYDLLLVPEKDAPVVVPAKVHDRLVHVGPVLSRERWELLPRAVAREGLGLPSDGPPKKCVFVSAGGGGDRDAEARIVGVVRALAADPALHVVVGAGPLYRGRPFPGVTIVPGRAASFTLAFDAAVCAAGYNTFGELMFAGVPTAFLPQDKLADDQAARARLAVERGAGFMLEPGATGDDIHDAVVELLARPGAPAAARSLVPENGARVAAAELLRLVCRPGAVDRVEAELDDACLAGVVAGGARELEVLGLAARLAGGCDDEGALGLAVERSSSLLAGRDAGEAREVRGLVEAVVRGLPSSSVAVRAAACDAAIAALAPATADGPGSLGPGDGAAARAAVADGRWGASAPDGALLAHAMRHSEPSSSSLRSSK